VEQTLPVLFLAVFVHLQPRLIFFRFWYSYQQRRSGGGSGGYLPIVAHLSLQHLQDK
jgi:hypothetical protein